jgi:hypothetical protein
MRSLLVIVSTPSLAFSPRIVEVHEPVGVEAFGAELAVERFDKGIVGRRGWRLRTSEAHGAAASMTAPAVSTKTHVTGNHGFVAQQLAAMVAPTQRPDGAVRTRSSRVRRAMRLWQSDKHPPTTPPRVKYPSAF